MDKNLAIKYCYTGTKFPKKGETDCYGREFSPYLPPDNHLIEAVNLAIFLKRPLLLKGEPGCGKTKLAQAVAYELELPYEIWPIKSTSHAKDGLYRYDAIGRLHDAQLAAAKITDNEVNIDNPQTYITWGALGKAFQNDKRTIVLIDEIDKADIDFPNDLLFELEEKEFIVDEIRDKQTESKMRIKAKYAPIIFITSNDEKELSDAFLRRCLYYYLRFPSPERLKQIIWKHFPISKEKKDLTQKAIERFLELRERMEKDKGEHRKKVSTSELLDWFEVLNNHPEDEALAKLKGKLPFASVLLKNWNDHCRYLNQQNYEN